MSLRPSEKPEGRSEDRPRYECLHLGHILFRSTLSNPKSMARSEDSDRPLRGNPSRISTSRGDLGCETPRSTSGFYSRSALCRGRLVFFPGFTKSRLRG